MIAKPKFQLRRPYAEPLGHARRPSTLGPALPKPGRITILVLVGAHRLIRHIGECVCGMSIPESKTIGLQQGNCGSCMGSSENDLDHQWPFLRCIWSRDLQTKDMDH